MGGTRPLDRLTASDLFLLLWDDYGWSTDIGGLAILDGTSLIGDEGRVRVDAVRRHLEPRLHLAPRFRQSLYRPRLGLGWPLWVDSSAALRIHRDRAMVDAMVLGGLRRCEVLRLRLEDLSAGERRLFVAEGKGGRQPARFFAEVGAYLDSERPAAAATRHRYVCW